MQPDMQPDPSALPSRNLKSALLRGLRGRCPACGEGRMFRAYLKADDHCPACNEALHHQRADDAPPYFTMIVVGHIVIGGMLILEERMDAVPLWLHATVWPTLAIALTLSFLPLFKGALIGHQWALRMHGFGDEAAGDEIEPWRTPARVKAPSN